MKKPQKDSNDFWHRKLTLKVKFWHFLTPPQYTNSQNSIIFCWLLRKNLSNFVHPACKLDNPYYHTASHNLKEVQIASFSLPKHGITTSSSWAMHIAYKGPAPPTQKTPRQATLKDLVFYNKKTWRDVHSWFLELVSHWRFLWLFF